MSAIHDFLNDIASKLTLSVKVKLHHNLMIPVRAHGVRKFARTLIFNLLEKRNKTTIWPVRKMDEIQNLGF